MISPWQRPLPDNTQHSQHTNIHALGGIRTHNLSRRAAKDLRLRPRGHWNRHLKHTVGLYWVPGHAGVRGNDIADELTRDGSALKFVGPEPALEVSRQDFFYEYQN